MDQQQTPWLLYIFVVIAAVLLVKLLRYWSRRNRLIQKYGMEKQVVVYINAEQQFHDWRRVAPAMPLMVSLPGSVKDVESLKIFLDKVHPEILDGDYDQYTQEMITTAQQLGYTVLPDIQGPAEGPALWEQPIQKGIKALQTDHPEDLIAWLVGKSIR